MIGWLRQNLFASPLNAALTLLALYLLYVTVPPLIDWAFIDADWSGDPERGLHRRPAPAGCSSACA